MGRWSYSDRVTVDECKSITTKYLNDHNYFNGGIHWEEISWIRAGEIVGRISIAVSTIDEYIRFQYTQTDRHTGEKTNLDYKARLTWTPCYFGGRRWWFICPLVVNGRVCNRRVGVLYLGSDKYFGCRRCYHLTYRCQKEHDSRVDALIKNPDMLLSRLNDGGLRGSILALRAYSKMTGKM